MIVGNSRATLVTLQRWGSQTREGSETGLLWPIWSKRQAKKLPLGQYMCLLLEDKEMNGINEPKIIVTHPTRLQVKSDDFGEFHGPFRVRFEGEV